MPTDDDLRDAAPVSWSEAIEHLVEYFMMDSQWASIDESGLSWWPGPLPLHVFVSGVVDEDTPDETLVLTASTDLFYLPDDAALGAHLAATLNETFHFGSFFWFDGIVKATTSVAWNRHCREMLAVFRQACLHLATRANQVAIGVLGLRSPIATDLPPELADAGALVCELPHPDEGLRTSTDEMLTIFGGSTMQVPLPDGYPIRLGSALSSYVEVLNAHGLPTTRREDGTDLVTFDNTSVVVEPFKDAELIAKYGPGITLRSRLTAESTASVDDLNIINMASVANASHGTSHFGSISRHHDGSLEYTAILDAAALAGTPALESLLVNAVIHAGVTADIATQVVRQIEA